jgi:hypothetical protein
MRFALSSRTIALVRPAISKEEFGHTTFPGEHIQERHQSLGIQVSRQEVFQ